MSKGKDKGKDKGKGKKAPEGGESGICVASHPRSAGAVRRAKGFGGLLGGLLATGLALSAQLPLLDAMMRGLVGGIVGYVALWAVAVTVARQLVIAEVRKRYMEVAQAAAAAAEAEAEGA
jgi:hypothetical protein